MTDRFEGIHALITGAASGSAPRPRDAWPAKARGCYWRLERMLDRAYELWGRLDVLLNNAGIAEVRPLLDLAKGEWDRMLAINLRAVFFVLQGAAKRMRQQTPIAASELRGKLIQTRPAPTTSLRSSRCNLRGSTATPGSCSAKCFPAPASDKAHACGASCRNRSASTLRLACEK
jgi:NAD(P)-dependent dehydrogenase (short-subunit alcohol dehydrogenase family)